MIADYGRMVAPEVGAYVVLALDETVVESSVGTHPAVDIIFRPTTWDSWESYFTALDAATEMVVGLLASGPEQAG